MKNAEAHLILQYLAPHQIMDLGNEIAAHEPQGETAEHVMAMCMSELKNRRNDTVVDGEPITDEGGPVYE